jgi:hypothetical protein
VIAHAAVAAALSVVGTGAAAASAVHSAAASVAVQAGTDADGGVDAREGWALTPDVILLGAATVMTVAVIVFGIWLFVRAARESDATPPERGGA